MSSLAASRRVSGNAVPAVRGARGVVAASTDRGGVAT